MIRNWILKLLNKNALKYSSKVELSIGTIYLKPLTNGIVNNARKNSCIAENILNDPYFFQLMDYALTDLSKSKIDSLSVEDGNLLRDTIRNTLLKAKVIKVEGVSEDKSSEFSAEDIRAIDKMKAESKADLEKLYNQTGYQAPGVNNG